MCSFQGKESITYILEENDAKKDAKNTKMPTSKYRHCNGLALECNHSHSIVAIGFSMSEQIEPLFCFQKEENNTDNRGTTNKL